MSNGLGAMLIPPHYFVLWLALMTLLHMYLPLATLLDGWLRGVGLVPLSVGLGCVLWHAGALRRAGTPVRPFEPPTALVQSGLYRYSRNPIYLGLIAMLAGVALLQGTLMPLLAVPGYAVLLDRAFVRPEERMLAAAFGEPYRQYCRHVRRWL